MALPTLTYLAHNGLKEVLGKVDVFLANYKAAGADSDFAYYIGSIDDSLVMSGGPEFEQVMGGIDFPYETDSVFTKDTRRIKFTLRDLDHVAMGILRGGLATFTAANTVGTVTNTSISADAVPAPLDPHMIAEGGLVGTSQDGTVLTPYYQVILRSPNAGTVASPRYRGWRQYWKCVVKAAGDEAFKRTEATKVDVEVIVHADRGVTPAIAAGPPVTATGYFGKIIYARD